MAQSPTESRHGDAFEAAGGATAAPAVSVRALDYAFGQGEASKQVLFGIDLELAPGEFAIMTGPSGSGKATLLGLIGALR